MRSLYMIREGEGSLRYDFECNQEFERLEFRISEVRRFRELSPAQQAAYINSGQFDVREAVGRIYEEASAAYKWACSR